MSIPHQELPLFPLNTVLFPGMTLPLRIFEPRYLQMVRDCMQTGSPFGVVLIREGAEVGGPAIPHSVGTMARVIALEQESYGVLHITTVGQERFRIMEMLDGKPYQVGLVHTYPLEDTDADEVGVLTDIQSALLSAYLDLLSRLNAVEIRLQNMPDTPESLAYLAAMLLQISLADKQRLLAVPDLPALLRQEASLLRGEIAGVTVLLRANEILDRREGESDPGEE